MTVSITKPTVGTTTGWGATLNTALDAIVTELNAQSGTSGLVPTAVKTAAYTAAVSDLIPVDTTPGAVTVTLPTAPADKTQVAVKLVIQGTGNNATIAAGGSDVFNKTGGSTTLTLSTPNQLMQLQYKASTGIWYVVNDSLSLAVVSTKGLPAGMTGAGNYDASRGIYNLKPSHLRKSRAKLGKATAGTGLLEIACCGPSTTEGFPQQPATQSYPAYLAKLLAARGLAATPGWVWVGLNGQASTDDARWTFTNFTKNAAHVPSRNSSAAGATAVFASTDAGTVIEYVLTGNYGAHTVTVDGGAAVPVSAASPGINAHTVLTAGTGLANTTHTLTITATSATSVFVQKARVRPAAGVLVSNFGWGGSQTTEWDTTVATGYYNLQEASVSGSVPDLVVFEAGIMINDYDISTKTAAQAQVNLANIVSQYKALGCEVLLSTGMAPSTTVGYSPYAALSTTVVQQFRQAMYNVADSADVPLIEHYDRLGDWAITNAAGLMADAYHATPSGYAASAKGIDLALAAL